MYNTIHELPNDKKFPYFIAFCTNNSLRTVVDKDYCYYSTEPCAMGDIVLIVDPRNALNLGVVRRPGLAANVLPNAKHYIFGKIKMPTAFEEQQKRNAREELYQMARARMRELNELRDIAQAANLDSKIAQIKTEMEAAGIVFPVCAG